eukprot:c6386_g1_i1.p1 GENE.c6386_g1_i1~~c6386_g1_i1.p1  ORF type:complete len:418 (+),score=134.98 c6386_g1_i1:80-1333(+)
MSASDYEHAVSIMQIDPKESESILKRLAHSVTTDEESSKTREQSIYKLAELFAKQSRVQDIVNLLEDIKPFFVVVPKARTAKIVRTLIDQVGTIPNARSKEIELCLEWINWTKAEKRTFLRQRLEAKLAALYLSTNQFRPSLEIITRLLLEVKRLDDKAMLVEIQLLESRCHHALQNLPKSKAALTAARTSANSIYVPPLLQAEIDVLAGTLHAEEKDYKTAYSYFYEAFENYGSMNADDKALLCLKYMLMCKIMTNNPEDVSQIVASKAGIRYTGNEVEAMKAIAAAHEARSLQDFKTALKQYDNQLGQDIVVHSHLAGLYETLLEQNLARLIEPFSRVQIKHIADLIDLPLENVEAKLSQMILDNKLQGILDQGSGCLILHSNPSSANMYEASLETLEKMGEIVEALFKKTQHLS